MCTSPKIIKNPRKHFIPYVDKEYLAVPCGHCKECRDRKRSDLFVLAYYEHLSAIAKGGFTQFFTLTYDDDNLPRHGYRPCFSREDVQKYFKRVVTSCKREFGKDFKIRRLVTCEYGTQNRRPHYHFLVYVQQSCNHFKFRQILKKSWQFGFSFGSWDNFGEVNRASGIRYVTKYVAKDCFDDSFDKDVLDECKAWSDKAYYSKRRVMPFTLRSKHFGWSAISHLYGRSDIPKYLQLPLYKILETGCICSPDRNGYNHLTPLPRSLLRQLIYNVTWRYKRITKRDKELHEIRDTKCPKKKVQTHYIPNHLYKDYKTCEYKRRVEAVVSDFTLLQKDFDYSNILYSIFEPPFVIEAPYSSMSDSELFSRLLDINIIRDPIYERDPFDKNCFYYVRAPLERTSYPDIRKKLESLYSYHSASLYRSILSLHDCNSAISSVLNRKLEKTYRDNKALCV